jgi:hypothetical protein
LLPSTCRNGAAGQKKIFMMVLHQFNWLQFGIAAIILAVCWYTAVLLLFFRGKVQALFKGNNKTRQERAGEDLRRSWDNGEENWDDELQTDENLMGSPLEDDGVSRLSFSEFGFAPREETLNEVYAAPETRENAKDELRGLIPDVLEEVKSIVHTVEIQDGGKADFISLFKLVSAKYERLKTSSHLDAINEWIMDNVPFDLTEDEVMSLWD